MNLKDFLNKETTLKSEISNFEITFKNFPVKYLGFLNQQQGNYDRLVVLVSCCVKKMSGYNIFDTPDYLGDLGLNKDNDVMDGETAQLALLVITQDPDILNKMTEKVMESVDMSKYISFKKKS